MTEAADIHTWDGPTMDVAIKIWRVDEDGERDLVSYELEAPEWACLLDVLDLIKDRHDGTLAYRKSCRMMICGSCGMRMDGRAVLACKERMKPIVESGHVPVISPMGNLPIIKDLVVDMGPFWQKIRDVKPWLDSGYDEASERERVVSQQQMNVIQKEALCIMCGCCVSECNAMEADPDFRGPAALAKGMRFVGDPRDETAVERLNELNDEHGIWDCTRCYFCNERCPKGVDPRDAIAKLGAESVKEGIDWDMGVKHAKWFVTSTKTTGWLRETDLVPEDAGHSRRAQGDEVRAHAREARQGAAARADPRRGRRRRGAQPVRPRQGAGPGRRARDRPGRSGARQDRAHRGRESTRRRGGDVGVKVAYYKGCLASLSAKELDTSTQALAPKLGIELDELESVTCCGAGDIHEAEPDYYLHLNARILAYGEQTGADTLMTICNVCTLNLRQANWQLKNDDELRARVNQNLETVGAPPYSGNVEVKHLLWLIAEGDGYDKLKEVAHKGLKGLKVAPFYGCQILRPSKLLGFEDPDKPHSLEAIIDACGGEAIDYPAKIKCCGFPIIQAREETALGELLQPIEQATEAGADVMVTPCPLCHLSLDAWQSKLRERTGKDFQMPILHLSQLIGVAAGLDESELKFKRHVVPVKPALDKIEV